MAKYAVSGRYPFLSRKATLLAATTILPLFACIDSASADILNNAGSGNWSGYSTNTGTSAAYTSVTGSFVVPTIASVKSQTYVSVWVGLDGYGTDSSGRGTVEQTGIAAYTDSFGNVGYYAWYEFYDSNNPSGTASVVLNTSSYRVRPGDAMTASVTYVGSNMYTLDLINSTRNWEYKSTMAGSNDSRISAEWIVEAPTATNTGQVYTLSAFTPVTFTGASAVGDNGTTGSISAFNTTGIDMYNPSTHALEATAGSLNSNGTSFTVNFVPEPASLSILTIAGTLCVRRKR